MRDTRGPKNINYTSVTINELPVIEEAFITSSSWAILPVIRIDDEVIGFGKPGLITHRLMGYLKDCIRREIVPIRISPTRYPERNYDADLWWRFWKAAPRVLR